MSSNSCRYATSPWQASRAVTALLPSSLASATVPHSLTISDVLTTAPYPKPTPRGTNTARRQCPSSSSLARSAPPERGILLCKPGETGTNTVAQSLCSARPFPGLPCVLRLPCAVLLGLVAGVIGPQPVFLAASDSVCVPHASLAISPSCPSLSRKIADNFTFYTHSLPPATWQRLLWSGLPPPGLQPRPAPWQFFQKCQAVCSTCTLSSHAAVCPKCASQS